MTIFAPQSPPMQYNPNIPISDLFPKSKIRPPPPVIIPRPHPVSPTIPSNANLNVPIMGSYRPSFTTPVPSIDTTNEGKLIPLIPSPFQKQTITLNNGQKFTVVNEITPITPHGQFFSAIPQVNPLSPPGFSVNNSYINTLSPRSPPKSPFLGMTRK